MDLESTQNNALAKLQLLKQEDGNSFKPVARTTTNADGTSTSTIPGPLTAEERILKRNDVKARSILLMAIPNEHQLTFNQYKVQTDMCILHLSDDLYNNFKIVEQEVKGFISSSSTTGSQNIAFVSTPGSTNEDTAHILVSTASTPVSAASTSDSAASLSDSTIYAFLANQPYGSQIVHEDLEQIHDDDLEEIDLKWQLALLSMRAKKWKKPLQRLAVDGAGFDWSFMAEEEVPTNMELMAFLDLEVQKDKTCSSICLKSFETLKAQYDNLRIDCHKTKFDLANYKRALASVEEQHAFYKQNEVIFTDKIAVLKRDAAFNEAEIITLKTIIEKLKKEKEDNLLKINNYDNATKSLDKVIGSQLIDNNKKGLGYNAIPPPPTGLFIPPSIDLSHSGIEKFKEPEFVGYGVKVDKIVSEISSVETKKTPDAPIIKDWVSDCEEDEIVSKVVKSVNVQQKPKQANEPRNVPDIMQMVLNQAGKDKTEHVIDQDGIL
ncbi:hypothetical protein Tco_1290321 [Tanacetum coccineum]